MAKTYRILHAIFATAVDDDLIRRNPCRIKRARQDKAEERPTATLDQVFAIAEAIQPRYRLLVLLATFGQLRFGELVALRKHSIDLDSMELYVRRATAEMEDGTQVDDDPKSEAGKRPISLPDALRRRRNFNRVTQGAEGCRSASRRGVAPSRPPAHR